MTTIKTPTAGSSGWDSDYSDNLSAINTTLSSIRNTYFSNQTSIDAFDADSIVPRVWGFNMGFYFWQRGTSFDTTGYGPDMWEIEEASSGLDTVTRQDGDSLNSRYMARIATNSGSGKIVRLKNYIPYTASYSRFWKILADQGQTVSFSMDVKNNNATLSTKVFIWNGSTYTLSSAASGTSLQRLTVTKDMSGATGFAVGVQVDDNTAGGAYCDVGNAAVGVGTYSEVDYIPIHLQDDLFGCCGQYQKFELSVGYYNKAASVVYKQSIPYPCPMIATPAATVTAGTSTGSAAMASRNFVPTNNKVGYLTTTGSTKDGRNQDERGIVVELEVT